nr:hypothetical protein BaRGS_009876 [Batillaria attramentaria]
MNGDGSTTEPSLSVADGESRASNSGGRQYQSAGESDGEALLKDPKVDLYLANLTYTRGIFFLSFSSSFFLSFSFSFFFSPFYSSPFYSSLFFFYTYSSLFFFYTYSSLFFFYTYSSLFFFYTYSSLFFFYTYSSLFFFYTYSSLFFFYTYSSLFFFYTYSSLFFFYTYSSLFFFYTYSFLFFFYTYSSLFFFYTYSSLFFFYTYSSLFFFYTYSSLFFFYTYSSLFFFYTYSSLFFFYTYSSLFFFYTYSSLFFFYTYSSLFFFYTYSFLFFFYTYSSLFFFFYTYSSLFFFYTYSSLFFFYTYSSLFFFYTYSSLFFFYTYSSLFFFYTYSSLFFFYTYSSLFFFYTYSSLFFFYTYSSLFFFYTYSSLFFFYTYSSLFFFYTYSSLFFFYTYSSLFFFYTYSSLFFFYTYSFLFFFYTYSSLFFFYTYSSLFFFFFSSPIFFRSFFCSSSLFVYSFFPFCYSFCCSYFFFYSFFYSFCYSFCCSSSFSFYLFWGAGVAECFQKAMQLQSEEKWLEVITCLNKAINLKADEPVFYRQRGEAYIQLCDFQSAILNYKKACMLSSGDAAAISCLAALQRHGECLALVNKRLEVDHDNPDLYVMRARLHEMFRNTTLCYYDVKDALALQPDHPEARQMMSSLEQKAAENRLQAMQLNIAGKHREALQKISIAIETNPSVAEYHVLRGALHRKLNDFNAAIDDFLLALDKCDHDEENPTYANAQRQLLLTYNDFAVECFNKGFYDEAVILLNKAIKGEKNEKGLYINRGDCFFKQGELNFAMQDYHQALELDGSDAAVAARISVIHNEFGVNLYQDKNYVDAEAKFTLALQCNPHVGQYYISRSRARYLPFMYKNLAGARQDLLLGLLLDPTNEDVLSILARLFPGKSVADVINSPAAAAAQSMLMNMGPAAALTKAPPLPLPDRIQPLPPASGQPRYGSQLKGRVPVMSPAVKRGRKPGGYNWRTFSLGIGLQDS